MAGRTAATIMIVFASLAATFCGSDAAASSPPPATSAARAGALALPHVPRRPARIAERPCAQWHRLVSRLGETFAGYRLRQSITAGVCEMASRGPRHWSWPWSVDDPAAELPPRIAARHADWEIRCSDGPGPGRCAAVLDPGAGRDRWHTHFVVDTVAGRDTVLWRLFIHNRGSPSQPMASGQRLRFGHRVMAATACTPAGCFIEMPVTHSEAAALRLAAGEALQVSVQTAGGEQSFTLSAPGFRLALDRLLHPGGTERHAGERLD